MNGLTIKNNTMDNKTKEKRIIEALKEQDVFLVKSVDNINHVPHPYMIGPRHIKHANERGGGGLGEETCREVRCAHPNCRYSYDEHTSDNICFLQLKRNATVDEVDTILKKLVNDLGEQFIDGFCFVETNEKYRVGNEKTETENKG